MEPEGAGPCITATLATPPRRRTRARRAPHRYTHPHRMPTPAAADSSPFPPMDAFGKSAQIATAALPIMEDRVTHGDFDTLDGPVGLGTTRKLVLRLPDGSAVECVVIGVHSRRLEQLRRAAEWVGLGRRVWEHRE